MCQVGVKLKSHLWGVNGSLYAATHELPLKVGDLFRVCEWEQSQSWEKPADMERLYMLYMSSDTKIPLLESELLFNLDQMHFLVKIYYDDWCQLHRTKGQVIGTTEIHSCIYQSHQ